MNLYGYAAGDPINNRDPLGLCPDSASTEELEECERREAETQARIDAERAAQCRADLRQFAVALTLEVTGVKLFRFLKTARRNVPMPIGQWSNEAAAEVTFGVAVHPALAIAKFEVAQDGGSQYFHGQAALVYAGAKALPIPGLGSGLELGEAIRSCGPR